MRTWNWPEAPRLLEDIYNFEDVLQVGCIINTFIRRCDVVRIACIAQLVNVIAPIMTETGGPAWRQTIFHPFAHFSRLGRGRVLRAEIDSPTYAARYNDPHGPIDEHFAIPAAPYLKLSAVHDDKAGTLTLFALNRSLDEALPLRLEAGGFGTLGVKQALQLCDSDLKAVNTRDNPDRIAPKPLAAVRTNGQCIEASLAPASWNVIQLTV
jgi:alpha-N-arabinofuranosidase